MKKIILLFAALSMLILYPFTEGYAATAGKPAAKKAAPKAAAHTVFDFSHAEIFSPVANGELDYTSFHEMIKASGATTAVNTETAGSHVFSMRTKTELGNSGTSTFAQEGTALKN